MLVGLGDGVGHCHDVANFIEKCLFISLVYLFWENRPHSFSKGVVFGFSLPLGMPVAEREPTPCCHDAYSVGTTNRAVRVKSWHEHCKTMVSPFLGRFFSVSRRTIFFGFFYGSYIVVGPDILGLALGFSLLVSCLLNLSVLVAG